MLLMLPLSGDYYEMTGGPPCAIMRYDMLLPCRFQLRFDYITLFITRHASYDAAAIDDIADSYVMSPHYAEGHAAVFHYYYAD